MTRQRGTVTIVVCAAAFLLMLGGLAVADAGLMLILRARAQAAADAAALAAVAQQIPVLSDGEDPERAAEIHAQRNGAELIACECDFGTAWATVTVEIRAEPMLLAAWTDRRIVAGASAEADPGLLTYRR